MSERVLHEWTDALGDEWRLIDGPRPMGMGFQRRSAESGWVWAAIMPSAVPDLAKALLGLVREVHRLTALRKADLELHEDNAARVAELEAENTKLREGAFSKTVASEVEEALRDRIAADTALTDKSKGDTPLGYVRIESLLEAFENLSFVRQQLTDAKQQLEETKWECRNLEAENAKLRKCVEAADAFFLVEDAMSNATEEGVGKDLWIESQEHRNSYDAARAEVDK